MYDRETNAESEDHCVILGVSVKHTTGELHWLVHWESSKWKGHKNEFEWLSKEAFDGTSSIDSSLEGSDIVVWWVDSGRTSQPSESG